MTIVGYGYGISPGGAATTKIVEGLSVSVEINLTGGVPGVAKDNCGREVKNWCFTRGDNPTIVVTVTDANSADPLNPDPVDLTGATAKLTVDSLQSPVGTATQIFELTGAVQAPATGGIIHFQPTTVQANQTPGSYFYDVQVILADGTRRTIATGDWEYDAGDISDPGAS